MPKPAILNDFNKDYRDVCFYSWYEAGCPINIRKTVPETEDGRKPTSTTLKRWMRDDGWRERADALDAQLSIQVDNEIIERKKQDYIELSETGRSLIKGAVDYLETEGYDSSSAAVRAVQVGADMLAKYSRAAEMIDSITGKSDSQIEREIFRLLGKNSAVDAEIVNEGQPAEPTEETDADSDTEENDNSE